MARKTMRIRKDDTGDHHLGQGQGQDRQGRTDQEPGRGRVYVENLNIVKRHQRPRSVKDTQRGGEAERDHREGGADRRLQRDAARPRVR